jgi:hypothetical protein
MNAPVKFAGMPSGPKLFVKELGKEVGTFLEAPGGKLPALEYHVPLNMRGPFRPDQLANYSPNYGYRVDNLGYVLCSGFTKAGEKCLKRAENRCPRCNIHGGRLHPLDQLIKVEDEENLSEREKESLSRYALYKAGQITVDDLDDEELATCGFRAKNGKIYKPRNIPRDLAQAFTKAIYERAQQELKAHTVKAAHTVAEIMMNKNIEPDIRLKAANTLLDRGLGKASQTITLAADSSFEQVFEGILSGSRESSRAARANVIDADVVELGETEQHSVSAEQYTDTSRGTDPYTREIEASNGATTDSGASRLNARNPAVLAQTVEIKPFEYDLTDKSDDIKKSTQKRYASRAAEVDGDIHFIREALSNGMFRHVLPKAPKPAPKSQNVSRKQYTLSDFT